MVIMLIEDNATDLKLLSTVLHSSGHRVLEKGSAEQAFEEIKMSQPEVILLDLKLPGMDGLALARLLKKEPDTRHIPIVAITAEGEDYTRQKALDAGCDAYILKPVDTRKLSDQVTSLVARPPKGLGTGAKPSTHP
jgi:two-component system cell cycle response regulator